MGLWVIDKSPDDAIVGLKNESILKDVSISMFGNGMLYYIAINFMPFSFGINPKDISPSLNILACRFTNRRRSKGIKNDQSQSRLLGKIYLSHLCDAVDETPFSFVSSIREYTKA
jgi:hypothetical protein